MMNIRKTRSSTLLGKYQCLWTWFALCLLALTAVAAHGQAYTSIVVFGDSLCDTGNDAFVSRGKYTVNAQVPGPATGYTDGRFTDGSDTSPAARLYTGVWVEQVAARFAAKPAVVNSLSGGTNYAYGFATTDTGTTLFTYGPGNALSFTVNNMGQQVSDYLATKPTITSKTLFIVWGGANDLINATSSADIVNAASRDLGIVQQLINAGATDILVPNLPPLGLVPRFNGSPSTAAAATAAAQGFDQALAVGFANLVAANTGKSLNLVSLDVYTLFNTIVGPPVVSGFTNVTASAQGNTTINPDTYLFWDDLHPTTFGHSKLAAAALTALGPVVTTTSTLVASSNTINLKGSVTFTASVTAASGTPIGLVNFLDGTTSIGSVLLNGSTSTATATLTTATLGAGSHSITAAYMGINGYGSSTSAVLSEVVVPPSVAISFVPSSITVARGSVGSTFLTITPAGGYSGAFSIACGSLPTDFTCAISSPSVTVSSTSAISTAITIGTRAVTATAIVPGSAHSLEWALLWFPLLGGAAYRARLRCNRSSLPIALILMALSTALLLSASGCSGDHYANAAASGTYQLPVVVTPAGGTASTVNLTVTVQ